MADQLPNDVPCPLCRSTMADIEAGPPFWQRWREIVHYPAERTALVFIGALALINLLVPAGLVSLLVGIPLLALFLHYAFVVFDRSACGHDAPPEVAELVDTGRIEAGTDFVKIGYVYAVVVFAGYMSGSWLVLGLVLALASMAFPASVMAAASDENFSAGFDYRRLSDVAQRLGPVYNLLAAATLAVTVLPGIVLMLPGLLLPTTAHAAALTLLYGYAGMVLARTIGIVLGQYRRELQFPAGVEKIDRPFPPKPPVYEPIQALADARVQLAEGQADAARMTIGEAMTRYPRNTELNRRFEDMLKAGGHVNELKNHLERVLRRMVADGNVGGAVDHWQRHRKTLGDWLPRISATRYRMSLELEKRGEYRTAVRLLLTLPKTDPRYARLPEACLEAARMLEEHFSDSASAEPLRNFVRNRYPDRAADWFEQYQLRQTG